MKSKNDRKSAARLARLIGCSGAHQNEDGVWMPCGSHEELAKISKDAETKIPKNLTKTEEPPCLGCKGNKPERSRRGSSQKKRWEKLRESGVSGINTLEGGGLTSAPIAVKRLEKWGFRAIFSHGEKSLNERQEALYEATEKIVAEHGMFDQGSGPDGAHYMPAAKNPFIKDGLVCSNCAYWVGPAGCEIVKGKLEPNAICKLWVIQGSRLNVEEKSIGRSIGGGGRNEPFDPNAEDGDEDGRVQDGSPFERPATPKVPDDEDLGGLLSRLAKPGEGFSVSISNMSDAKSGWAIARSGKGIKVPAKRIFNADGSVKPEGDDLLLAYILSQKEEFLSAQKEGRKTVLGAWHNDQDGIVYFDVTDVYDKDSMSEEEAIKEGKKQNQISIADLDEISAAVEDDNWDRRTVVDSGGSGSTVIPLTDLNPLLEEIRKDKNRSVPDKTAPADVKVEQAPDGILMQVTEPVESLGDYHTVDKNWSEVRAIPIAKMKSIADFYDDAPDLPADEIPEEARKAWEALRDEVEEQFRILTEDLGITVEFVDEDPYESFAEMYADFVANQRLKIMKTSATGGHPFFTDEENDMFRAVHDAFGHLATGRGFDRHGEEAAFQAHKSMFSPTAAKAAATELRGQNSFLIARGEFGPQKIVLLPEEMQKRLLPSGIRSKAGSAEDISFGRSKEMSDADNAYDRTGSHHVSCGRLVKR